MRMSIKRFTSAWNVKLSDRLREADMDMASRSSDVASVPLPWPVMTASATLGEALASTLAAQPAAVAVSRLEGEGGKQRRGTGTQRC